jgi:hypothetical protein
MLSLFSPVTLPRYLSEVRVLVGIRTRPIRLEGTPLATVDELFTYLLKWGLTPERTLDPQQLVVGDHTLILFDSHSLTVTSPLRQ